MSTPPDQQPRGTAEAVPASMVRVCDRCGTVCAADQEWCLNCGVRMTEVSQRLPGLRAAGLVVALAVLLAGGAAAASYAALRGDARSAANVPATTTGAPVAQAPAPAPAPVAPVTTAPAPAAATPKAPAKKSPAPAESKGTAPAASDASGEEGSAGGGTAGGGGTTGTGGGSTGTGGGDTGSTGTTGKKDTSTPPAPRDESGPILFASGQGSIYDPESIAEDIGDQRRAIDGSSGTSWKVVLKPGESGGLGYVLDFDDPTAVKTLKVNTRTAGLKIKVLGTTSSVLPRDVLDNGWETIASERTLKAGSNSLALKAVSGAKSKYRHVLVLFTSVPGTPATADIREFSATR